MAHVNCVKLFATLRAAALPVIAVDENGKIDYSRDLTAREKGSVQSILEAHDPAPSDPEIIKEQVFQSGIDPMDLLIALWLQIKSDDSTYADQLHSVVESALDQISV